MREIALDAPHFVVALDPTTGAIIRLRAKAAGREWASAENPLALFGYQTLSKAEYDRFFEAYLKSHADWAPKDFGKPNIERFGAQSRTWHPERVEAWHQQEANGHRIVARLAIGAAAGPAAARVAWPRQMYLELFLPDAEPKLEVAFSWFGKASNRMPEALWLTFQPAAPDPTGWMLDKCGAWVSPFDVVTGGNRAMHAVARTRTLPGHAGDPLDRDDGRPRGRARRTHSAVLHAPGARPLEGVALQPVQQRLGDQLYTVVRRRHALPFWDLGIRGRANRLK